MTRETKRLLPIVTPKEMRTWEEMTMEQEGVPGLILMESAGMAVTEEAIREMEQYDLKEAVIVCGKGNNGGDGFVIGRQLLLRGYKVHVLILEEEETYG